MAFYNEENGFLAETEGGDQALKLRVGEGSQGSVRNLLLGFVDQSPSTEGNFIRISRASFPLPLMGSKYLKRIDSRNRKTYANKIVDHFGADPFE